MIKVLYHLISRDFILFGCKTGEASMPLLFFVMIVSIFPIALGPQNALLLKIAPAMIWIAVILSLLMSLAGLFQADYQQGILEQYLLSPYPLSWIVFSKAIAHSVLTGIPLWILAMLAGVVLQLNHEALVVLGFTLALGIPALSFIGSLMAALTLGLSQGGVLLSVLALPLMFPVMIFGTSGVQAASQGLAFMSEILLLAALLVLMCVIGPVAVAAAIKTSVE